MLRLVCFVIGIYLVGFGFALTSTESGVVNARFIARDGRPRALSAKDFEIEQAYLALSSRNTFRGDWLEPEMGLALELDRIGYPSGFLPSPLREARIRQSAERLGRASPAAAEAWCLLALSEAKAGNGSHQLLAERLRACFALGPRERALFRTRLHLGLAAWDGLPKDLKIVVLAEVASALQGAGRGRMLDMLAYGVAVIAPEREAMLLALIEPHGAEPRDRFKKQILAYRKRYGAQLERFQ